MKWLIAISASSLILGCVGIGKIIASPMPEGISIRDEFKENKENQTYNGKYAENYLDYLVSSEDEDNREGGTGAFNNKYLDQAQPITQKFKSEFIGNGDTLSKACQQAYESSNEKIKGEDTTSLSNDEFKESEVGKYCSASPEGKKIKSMKETPSAPAQTEGKPKDDDTTYGKPENQDKLISVDAEDNEGVGEIKTKLFYEQGEEMGKAEDKNPNSEFRKFYLENKNKFLLYKKDLKDKCKEAYGKKADSDAAKYPEEEVFKFCSIKGSK